MEAITVDIRRGAFHEVERVLQRTDVSLWPTLADHLFQFCDEIGPLPLINKIVHQPFQSRDGCDFNDLIAGRIRYGDRAVAYTQRFSVPFRERARERSKEWETAGVGQREVISCRLVEALVCDYVEEMSFCPVQFLCERRREHGRGTEVLCIEVIDFFKHLLSFIQLAAGLDGPSFKESNCLIEKILQQCSQMVTVFCQQRTNRVGGLIHGLCIRWNDRLNRAMDELIEPVYVDQAHRILIAQVLPDERRIKKEEESLARCLQSACLSRSSSLASSGDRTFDFNKMNLLCQKLNDPRWKVIKKSKGIIKYGSSMAVRSLMRDLLMTNGQGVSSRIDLDVRCKDIQLLLEAYTEAAHVAEVTFTPIEWNRNLVRYKHKYVPPFSPRYGEFYLWSERDGDDEGAVCLEDSPDAESVRGHLRVIQHLCGAHFKRKDSETFHMRLCTHLHLGGGIPQWTSQLMSQTTSTVLKKNRETIDRMIWAFTQPVPVHTSHRRYVKSKSLPRPCDAVCVAYRISAREKISGRLFLFCSKISGVSAFTALASRSMTQLRFGDQSDRAQGGASMSEEILTRVLDETDVSVWPGLATHLFGFCDEIGPLPLINKIVHQPFHNRDGCDFNDLIADGIRYGDRAVAYTQRFSVPFREKAKETSKEWEIADADGKEIISCRLVEELLSEYVENMSYCPVSMRQFLCERRRANIKRKREVLCIEVVEQLKLLITFMEDTETRPDIEELRDSGTSPFSRLLSNCSSMLKAMCDVQSQGVHPLIERWSGRLNEAMEELLDPTSVDLAHRIFSAQVQPDVKRIKREEDGLRSQHPFDVNSSPHTKRLKRIQFNKLEALDKKLDDTRWKVQKRSKGKIYYGSSFAGISARTDMDIECRDLNVLLDAVFEASRLPDIPLVDISHNLSHSKYQSKLVYPFSPRHGDFYMWTQQIGQEEGAIMVEDNNKNVEEPLGYVRVCHHLAGAYFKRKDEKTFRMRYCLHVNMGGSIPQWLMSNVTSSIHKRQQKIVKKMNAIISRNSLGSPGTNKKDFSRLPLTKKAYYTLVTEHAIESFGGICLTGQTQEISPSTISMSELVQSLWPTLADHLFQFCDEIGPLPLINKIVHQPFHNRDGCDFNKLIEERIRYGDRAVAYTQRFSGLFREKIRRESKGWEIEDAKGEDVTRELVESLLSDYVENMSFCPVKEKGVQNKSGLCLEVTDQLQLMADFIDDSSRPDGPKESSSSYNQIWIQCSSLLRKVCQPMETKMDETVIHIWDSWNDRLNEAMDELLDPPSVLLAHRILTAQVRPDEKRIKREEAALAKYLKSLSTTMLMSPSSNSSASNESQLDFKKSDVLCKKLDDPRWKVTKKSKGWTYYGSTFGGISARVDLDIPCTDSISRLVNSFIDAGREPEVTYTPLGSDRLLAKYRHKYVSPFSSRYGEFYIWSERDGEDEVTVCIEDNPEAFPIENHVRVAHHLCGAHFKRKDAETFHMRYCLHVNMGGSIPQWLMTMTTTTILKRQRKIIKKLIQLLNVTISSPVSKACKSTQTAIWTKRCKYHLSVWNYNELDRVDAANGDWLVIRYRHPPGVRVGVNRRCFSEIQSDRGVWVFTNEGAGCRKSHISCDRSARPCARCVRRGIPCEEVSRHAREDELDSSEPSNISTDRAPIRPRSRSTDDFNQYETFPDLGFPSYNWNNIDFLSDTSPGSTLSTSSNPLKLSSDISDPMDPPTCDPPPSLTTIETDVLDPFEPYLQHPNPWERINNTISQLRDFCTPEQKRRLWEDYRNSLSASIRSADDLQIPTLIHRRHNILYINKAYSQATGFPEGEPGDTLTVFQLSPKPALSVFINALPQLISNRYIKTFSITNFRVYDSRGNTLGVMLYVTIKRDIFGLFKFFVAHGIFHHGDLNQQEITAFDAEGKLATRILFMRCAVGRIWQRGSSTNQIIPHITALDI
ncbi:hypothetical protein PROFUN_06903 [Planoprotostelium fungivorum]|uniref:Zn(2)-C6 fungal-type domain-containing protein n=1 Tax=Planoprotostelium fungivorum TaxID=1890364 RepID=A0A2P6NMW8_9EUKA|nr:hypothetical protein PROFUN_06903 [Planoprotostelium fungivorum]